MKKITSAIFAIILFALPARAAQEVELTSAQWEDVVAMYENLYGNSYNAQNYLLALTSYYRAYTNFLAMISQNTEYTVDALDDSWTELNLIRSAVYSLQQAYGINITNLISKLNFIHGNTAEIESLLSDLSSDTYLSRMYLNTIRNNTTNLAVQVALLRAIKNTVRGSDLTLLDLLSVFRLPGEEDELPDNIFNIPQNANTYSNLLSRYLQSYTNTIQNYYTELKNKYLLPYYVRWNIFPQPGEGNFTDLYPVSRLDNSSRMWSQVAGWYLGYGDNIGNNPFGTYDYYQSYMQYLNTLPGYSAFEDLRGKSTLGGLIGKWENNQIVIDPEKEAAAKELFNPETWANNSFQNIMQHFHRHFASTNVQEIAITNITDLLTINEAIANVSLAGNVKPIAENVAKIASNKVDNVAITNSLHEINVGISNIIASIHASESFVFPESVVSNLDEIVKRQDEYETDWRSFYSPTSAYNIQQQVDSIEQQLRQAEIKTAEISNKVQRTVATLTPEVSGIDRFLKKVKSYTQRNIVSQIPEKIEILDTTEINRFLRYHSDTIQFEYNTYKLDMNYEIYGGVRISDIIEGIRDLCKMFYAGMGLYFGFKLTMIFLRFMTRTVQYLGIYLNIKALLIK